jgi:hypothetical protein
MATANQNRRFSLDEEGFVIDHANLENSGRYMYRGDCKDPDTDFRRHLLRLRLDELVSKLIARPNARKARDSLAHMLLAAIEASQLNTLDPSLSMQYPFKGRLRRRKEGMQDHTSISLFVRDVERVLRDLYGDIDRGELDTLLGAVRDIVVEFTSFVRPDLRAEYFEAHTIDYRMGINREEGEGVSSREAGEASLAAMVLAVRAIEVASNPGAYCRYTIKFVKALDKYWPNLGGWDRRSTVTRVYDFR